MYSLILKQQICRNFAIPPVEQCLPAMKQRLLHQYAIKTSEYWEKKRNDCCFLVLPILHTAVRSSDGLHMQNVIVSLKSSSEYEIKCGAVEHKI